MWAQGRFQNMGDFARSARRLGFPGIEINYLVSPEGVEQLLASSEVAIVSLHAPTPRVRVAGGRWSEALNLASLDPEERRLSVKLGRRSLDLAAKTGASTVVFHLGGIGDKSFDEERELRRLYQEGHRQGPELEALRRRCRQLRAEGRGLHFPEARRSLAELTEHAAALGVAIGLENRYHLHEMPDIGEARELLAEYPQDLVGYWHDVGHAEVLHRLGLIDKGRWLEELGQRCLGAHLHDVDVLADHRPPGRGDADWAYVARGLPPYALRVLEINHQMPEDQVVASISFLREKGVL